MITDSNGLKHAYLFHVSVDNGLTQQSNKFYFMKSQPDGTVRCEWGRIGSPAKITIIQAYEFDKTYREKTGPKKGYKDQTELYFESEAPAQATVTTDKGEVVDIACSYVKSFFGDLMSYAKKSVSANYKAKAADVTEAQVNKAQAIVDAIAKNLKVGSDIKSLNNQLLELYSVITREMKDVRSYLFQPITDNKTLEIAQKLLSNEQDTLDTMAGQVQLIKQQREANKLNEGATAKKIDILDQMGLKISHVTDKKVLDKIKTLMGPNANQLKRVFEVSNIQTQQRYDNHVKNTTNKATELFWHGSRNENVFNILQTGLLLRPSNVSTNGKMFGWGTYFADKAQKSIGYTSLRGSYWTGGSENKAYLMLFNVHTGKQLHIRKHDSSCYNLDSKILKTKGEYDSVFAEGGIDLRNNEFIVYTESQCTIKYIVEISN